MQDSIGKWIKNPPKEYRPVPFWSWNDRLDPAFLRWQVNEMWQAGLGGYFMHARGGLETEYLREEWMDCIKACLEEGKRLGMNSWIYDEAGWPSGFAGGLVTALGDRYHARGLVLEFVDAPASAAGKENVLGVYRWNTGTNTVARLDADETASAGCGACKTIVVRHTAGPYYIDVLNREVVKAFIEYTHERYYSLFSEEFGKGLQGFFTDEPRLSEGDIPWSYILPEEFSRRYGYDLLAVLPALFIACEGCEKVRYDFWALVSALFVTAFMKQIYDWCEEHRCKLTGHVMMEESLYSQMTGTSGSMPFYAYMHIPGMDWLRRMISNPVVPKQVASVASQLGKRQVLTESYALCGWDVSFEELKWIAEWQFVNGVNLMCQHLEGYTLRGLRKRDYPPSLFFQQPWWKEYGFFNDYLSRLGVLLSSGSGAVDVLLLHPMRSGWIAYDGGNNDRIKKLDADFINASELLSGYHVDYHYGDESILAGHGRVEGGRLTVGQCSYRAVVLPSMLTLDGMTLELLEKFLAQGGTVVSLGDFPTLMGGVLDARLDRLREKVAGGGAQEGIALLKAAGVRSIGIAQDGHEIEDIRYQERELGDSRLFFLVNHSREKAYDATVTLPGEGRVRKYGAEEDRTEEISHVREDGVTKVELRLLPMQSHILLLEAVPGETPSVPAAAVSEIGLQDNWTIAEMDLNALTLDYCSYSVDEGAWTGPVPVIKLMDILLALKRSCRIAMKFNFQADMALTKNKELFLALEDAERCEIYINGIPVTYRETGWWKDSAFRKVDIKAFVKEGGNEILLKRDFYQSQKVYDVLFGENVYETERNKLTYDVELESLYIVGDFGVESRAEFIPGERKALFTDGPFVLVDRPASVRTGDLTRQGFCFFAGAVELSQNFEVTGKETGRLVINLGKPKAVLSKVYVNGRLVRVLPWAPYSADITDFVRQGVNKLAVRLFSGNRNLLGPHHHINGELYNVGPMSFTGKWSWCERPSEAEVIDENDRKRNYWKEGYCFVEFGL